MVSTGCGVLRDESESVCDPERDWLFERQGRVRYVETKRHREYYSRRGGICAGVFRDDLFHREAGEAVDSDSRVFDYGEYAQTYFIQDAISRCDSQNSSSCPTRSFVL